MACKMNCTLKGNDPKETMETLIKMVEGQGFVFKGTSTKGTFKYEKTLKASGEYSRSKKKVTLTVTKYPFFVTCGMIISELNKRLGDYLSCEED
ncbi:MAG: hypothetical protein HXS52_10750 [Theionarchaea archaeon]|nr:hypothetical protein [Theionarchaea archaeon]